MLSSKAVNKPNNLTLRATAVANVDKLFQQAILGWTKQDRNADVNIAEIHRFFVPMQHNYTIKIVKPTVKQILKKNQHNRLYTLEAVELSNKKALAATWAGSTVQSDGIDPTSVLSTKAVEDLAQAIENYNNANLNLKHDLLAKHQAANYHNTNNTFNYQITNYSKELFMATDYQNHSY